MIPIRGPGIFLAQFAADRPPFDSLPAIARWAASLGYRGVQIPSWDARLFDLERAAESRTYCEELLGVCAEAGVAISELAAHLQGQLVAVHPAYDPLFAGFAPPAVRHSPAARQQWAERQLRLAAGASRNLGLGACAAFSGALLWHTVYPWPQRPPGLVAEGFAELARRWRPILDAFDEAGVDLCFELHPGEDLHDGVTFERFLEATGNHPRACILYDPSHLLLQGMDYLGFIDVYHERIRMFHVKDAELLRDPRSGVYGGYQDWRDRPGRFRSLGDGQVDFRGIFTRLLKYGYRGWAVLEWECCFKHPEDGAREGVPFIARHLIRPPERAFDEFAAAAPDPELNARVLGLRSSPS
ncbi:MAG: AP endonuclease [Porticoccaceae bacterium]|nr:MAG: AP endonuclease [Porticoccaceae bacterium]